MHLNDQIEEYNFTHGKHFDVSTGQYDLLMPHDLGRPLTHEEMDYNFIYQKQTLNGFRIFGSGVNLRLDSNDLNKVLKFHQIALVDSDYALYVAEGYAENQYIWVPEELVSAPSGVYITLGVQAQLNEGQVALFTLTSANIPNNTTVGYTLSGIQPADLVNPSDMTGIFTMDGTNTSQLTIAIANDFLTEGTEIMLMTLDAADSLGISAGLTAQVDINDVSFPTYTSFVADSGSYNEGQTATYTLSGTSIPDGTQVGYTISGGAGFNVADISLGSLSGFITMSSGTGTLSFNIEEDNSFEGAETLEVTLNTQDSAGNATGLPMGVTVTILDVAPTYSITGNSTIAEGTTNTYTITTHNVAPATTLYWELRNSSTNQVDFATDITSPRTGQFTVNTVPSSDTIDIVVANDSAVEPNELIIIYVWDDAADVSTLSPTFDDVPGSILAGMTVTITDVVFPSYTSFSSITTLANNDETNEGEVVSWEIVTDNVISGTTIGYTITGVDAADIDVPLTGTITITGNNTYYNTNIALDNLTEGAETMTMTLDATDSTGTTCGLAHAVTILDTSQTPTPTFALVANSSTVNEGGNIVWTLTTTNVADNTTVPFTLSGPATIVDDYSNVDPKEFTITADSGTYTVTTVADNTTEGNETVSLTLGATDSAGNATGGLVSSVNVIDTSQDINQYQFIATVTDNIVNGWESPASNGAATGVINGSLVNAGLDSSGHCYAVPAMGYTYTDQNQVLMDPDQLTLTPNIYNPNLDGTINAGQFPSGQGSWRWAVKFILNANNIQQMEYANISLTDANGGAQRMYQSLTGPSTWAEGQGSNGLVILNTTGISDAFIAANPHSSGAYQPNGVTCGFTITGSATGGGVDYGSGGVINPVVLTTDAVGIDFSTIVADLITEGSETVTITLDDFDSLGNPTFGLTKTITITDDSQTPAVNFYNFHGGNQNGYPFTQSSSGLTDPGSPDLYFDDGNNAYAITTDLSIAMDAVMNGNAGFPITTTQVNGANFTAMGIYDNVVFPSTSGNEFYYIVAPDGLEDLTSVAPQHLVDGGVSTNAVERKSFTWNGNLYWLYRLGGGDGAAAKTITFSDQD